MEVSSLLPHAVSLFAVSMARLMIAVLCIVRRWPWKTAAISREAVLRLLGVRLGDVPTTVIRDGAVAVDALVRRADAFSDRPAGGGPGVVVPVPVRDCLYAALFALNVATCFGDGVDGELVDAMRAAQQEFLRFLPLARVFSTFQNAARLVYPDRWKQLLRHRRRQEEMYLPLIRAREEQRRTRGTTPPPPTYVDTLLDLEVPADGDRRRRKLSDGEMVGLVSEYLGAATGTVVAQLEWTLANLVRRPDIQTRLRGEVEAAGGEPCAYLRAVVMESLRRHPPVSSVQRHMARDVILGGTHVAQGNVIWTSPEEFSPERFMADGEGVGVRLAIGSKEEASKSVKMMPFGAGRRTCPGMGYAILHLEYFLANLVMAFEWRQVPGEEVDLTADHGFITTTLHPLRALVVPRRTCNDMLTMV
uniref:Cytochrome P450 n=1 Tax=Oryza punctata TaxID=4537 RepID=A0A0E0M9L9_ORYPU